MLTASNNSELDENRKQLQANLDHIDEISVKLDLWREEAERDQGRVGKSLAAMSGASTQQNSELITLTQQRLSEAQNTLQSLQRLDSEIHDARLVLAERVRELISAREGVLKSGIETVKTSSAKAWDLIWERFGYKSVQDR